MKQDIYDSIVDNLAAEVRDIAKVDFSEAEAFVEKKLGVDEMTAEEFEVFTDTLDQELAGLREYVLGQAEDWAVQVRQRKENDDYMDSIINDFKHSV